MLQFKFGIFLNNKNEDFIGMKNMSPPPTLTRRLMAQHLKQMHPEFPSELIQAAIKEILAVMGKALIQQRPVTLRGFGRFQPRRYQGTAKRLGLLFRPSPDLTLRLNRNRPEADNKP